MRRRVAAASVLALAALLVGCARSAPAVPAASTATPFTGTITVAAAASLAPVLPRLAAAFRRAHPGVRIRFTFGGSADLAAGIVAGSPVDVFAAASTATMATVTDAGRTATTPVTIARNRLEIAVPKGNPGDVTSLRDLADARRTIVLCAPQVPCGAAAQQVLALAQVRARPDSLEQSVTGVLTKVRLGEADAGLVYVTDVRAARGAVEGIPFTEADRALTDVLVAPLRDAASPALARAFTRYVVGQGRPTFEAAGFLAPSR